MSRAQRKLLDAIRSGWDEAQKLFSRAGKPLQERTAVHGFLQALGVEHADGEIIKRGPEPVDAWFRDARF